MIKLYVFLNKSTAEDLYMRKYPCNNNKKRNLHHQRHITIIKIKIDICQLS